MISWSATMSLKRISNYVLATWLLTTVGAITVSIDRSDVKTSPTRSSMIANGWRPLANGYEDTIGTNVKPANHLERNAQSHPVLGKFQEHMIKSEKLKPQRNKNKQGSSSNQDYSPPTILGSFTVFGNAAAKARGEGQKVSQQGHGNNVNKYVASETRDYTFLIPPPKDAFRFEHPEPPRKVIRDNSYSIVNDFLRQPAYVPPQVHQIIPDAVRAATYFIKGYTSTTNPAPSSPSKNNRPPTSYFNGYSNGVPQLLQPPRHQAKPFESLKISGNAKPYLQPPGTDPSGDFGKDDRIVEQKRRPSYERYQPQIHTSNSGNFYTQVNHPTNHYKTSYERDPAYLVHESHEVSYVTPSSIYNEYNFRPSVPYDTLLPPEVYSTSTIGTSSTTLAPQVQDQSSKYVHSNDVIREEDYYKNSHITTTTTIKHNDNHGNVLSTSGIPNTYYVSEQQDLTPPPASWPLSKNTYTSDINEVLPRVNPPNKFTPDIIQPSQLPQVPKMVYVNPQVHQYQSSIVPSQQHDYETPESISLKHFNEQQFIIQQQLVQRDRQRLAEQERQQQIEIERQQQEELKKHQEELEKLIKQQKEEEENGSSVEKNITDQIEFSKINNGERPYTIELPQYEIPRVTSQSPTIYNEQNNFEERTKSHGSQIQQPEVGVPLKTSFENQEYQTQFVPQQQTNYNKGSNNYQQGLNNQQQEYVNYQEPELQSHRQQKPSRDQYRRKKPGVTNTSSIGYENIITTDIPTQSPETLIPYTFPVEEIPVHTTVSPEPVTFPSSQSTTQRSRTRRPGLSGQRRRRPSTTTPEPVTLAEGEYYEKYEDIQQEQLDPTRRRRIKPTHQTNEETHFERRPNIRKRPGNRVRVNHGEPYEAEIVTEIIQTPVNTYKGNSEQHPEKYVEDNRQTSNLPNNQYFDYTSVGSQYTDDDHRDYTTEIIQSEYPTELTRSNNSEESQRIIHDHNHHRANTNVATNIPLEDLFVKTDGYYFDKGITTLPTATTATKTTTTTTTTTTSASTTTSTSTTTSPPSPSPPSSPPSTTTSIVKTVTQPSHVSSTTSRLKIRPMRFGNTTRPRFSIKDYKSRMDYKNRLSTTTTTTTTTEPNQATQSKQRLSNLKSQNEHAGNRDTTGRYKYMSRTSYRTTTVTPTNESENKFENEHNPTSSTTERSTNRFVPKRRPISGNLYRSRISATTNNPNRSQQQQQQDDSENGSKYSTVRPENVFSSSVRRRPINKNRQSVYKESSNSAYRDSNNNNNNNNNNKEEELATEMAAEETSFYSAVTTSASSNRQTQNDIAIDKDESESSNLSLKFKGENKAIQEKTNFMDIIKDKNDTIRIDVSNNDQQTTIVVLNENKDDNNNFMMEKQLESTTRFDVPSEEEELFAKASQSVADLTSSASALYDKPGMFKAVSPESRVISPHFKITTDEPTLPIEAFFQELSKKN